MAPKMHAIPIGTLTKKIHRQPAYSVSTPPASGPIATARPIVAPQIPKAVPRSRPWNSWERMASETANITAPPIPWRPRARLRKSGVVADPQSAEASVKRATPPMKTRFRPSQSPSVPAFRTEVASRRAYASTTHWRSVKEVRRSRWMLGSATLTIVMSRRSMKMATHTMRRARHLRSIRWNVLEKDSATLVRKVSDYGAHAAAPAPEHAGAAG